MEDKNSGRFRQIASKIQYVLPAIAIASGYLYESAGLTLVLAALLAAAFFVLRWDVRVLAGYGSLAMIASASLYYVSLDAANAAAFQAYWMLCAGLLAMTADMFFRQKKDRAETKTAHGLWGRKQKARAGSGWGRHAARE